jgi:hypothetical protein
MDLNEYLVEKLVQARLAELRADAAPRRWLPPPSVDGPSPARSFRARLLDSARWFVNVPRPPAPLSPRSGARGTRGPYSSETANLTEARALLAALS